MDGDAEISTIRPWIYSGGSTAEAEIVRLYYSNNGSIRLEDLLNRRRRDGPAAPQQAGQVVADKLCENDGRGTTSGDPKFGFLLAQGASSSHATSAEKVT